MKLITGITIILISILLFQLITVDLDFDYFTRFYFDGPSLLFFFFVIPSVTFIYGRRGAFITGIKCAFSKNVEFPDKKFEDAVGLFRLLRKSVLYAGFVVLLVGIIPLLSYSVLTDIMESNFHTVANVLERVSVSLTGIYYALIINLIFINPLIAVLQRRLKESGE
ncbi:MAG: hypothetical protein FWE90_06715 [Defluviitaleaceae bacterium]|nr:hypothetical protein [Defluviitaleaceae bacterium]